MLKRLGKKAQTTAEYAILIALVIGAAVAMQVYVRRGLQGRVRDAVDHAGANGTVGNDTFAFTSDQYEPYYLVSDASSGQTASSTEVLSTGGGVTRNATTTSTGLRNQSMGWTDYNASGP